MRRLASAVLVLLLCALCQPLLAQGTATAPPPTASPTPQAAAPASQEAPQAAPAEIPPPSQTVAVPEATPKAMRHYRSGNVLWAIDTLWGFAVPALILFTGFSSRMRDWAFKLGKYWYLALVVYFALFLLVTYVLDFPLDYYASFVRPHAYGLSAQAFSKWFTDGLKSLAIGFVMGALFLWVPYLLLRHAKKRWWLYTWLAALPVIVLMLFVEPIWIAPMFNKFGPMQNKTLEAKILHLAHRAGIENARVFEVNKSVDTKTLNAYATGIGKTQRIVLWDTIIKALPQRELLFVMGHEMGHYVLGHTWRMIFVIAIVLFVGLWLVHKTAGWLIRRYSSRFRFTELGDFASLPLIILLFGVFSFVITPIPLAYGRHIEHEADRFGLEITQDNYACGEAFVDLAKHDLGNPRPGWLYKIWRSTHPPLGERIDFCNSYHPWRDGKPLRYGHLFKSEPPPGG